MHFPCLFSFFHRVWAKTLSLVDSGKKLLTRKELIRKLVGSLAMAFLLPLILVYVNRVDSFAGGFLWCCGFCTVIAWYATLAKPLWMLRRIH